MRDDLPGGTVTFLFTDVEGSTRLLHELGARGYADALAEHRRLIRDACYREEGVEVDTQGDAFFFAFPTAPGALAAASTLTAKLAEGPIQVRVGLHTGTPLATDEGYVGADVHRAARIAAAGHGGQVLVSSSTATLVEAPLVDLGEHRFKDLAAAERVFQLGDREFPRLASLYRTNLPVPATPFLGRERELAEVVQLLSRDDVRLLTLTGPGGTGKTRLALQAAAEAFDHYPDGVFWVPLAPVRDATLVLGGVGQVLGATGGVASHVADKRMLLLLDNFEHLLDAAGTIATLLEASANLDVLVTSRELLQLRAEHVYAVPTLDDRDGVELFVARARAATKDFEPDGAVAEICERLDNLPLALELAASRLRHLTEDQLLARLTDRLDLLKGGRDADPRQQTLRATIGWSYDLLDLDEQRLLARLAVFAGGWTLEASEQICGADLDAVLSLVDKSLVRRTGERYWMLETIREFAAEHLDGSGETGNVRRVHAEYFLRLAESLGLTMENLEVVGAQRHDIAITEQNNLRAAIEWAFQADLELSVRIAFALENFWATNDPLEGIRRFDAFIDRGDELPPELLAAVLRTRGNCTILSGDRAGGVGFYERSLALYREAGDERGAALVEHRSRVNTISFEHPVRVRSLLEESLVRFRELGMKTGEAQVLGSLGWLEHKAGNDEQALELLRESAELARAIGFAWTESSQLTTLALLTLELGRLTEAEAYASDGLVLARRMGDRFGALSSLALLARVASAKGDAERAGMLWGAIEAEEKRAPVGMWQDMRGDHGEAVLRQAGPDLERGRAAGARMSFDAAIEHALEAPADA